MITIDSHVTRNFGHRRRYRSDLSDTVWARIARFLVPKHPIGGRPCPPHRWREYLDAMLYVLRTGCAWRHLPHDFAVSWSAAHKHFLRWCRNGTWAQILTTVRGEVRTRSGRRRRPTAGVVDSSNVKASPATGPRGFERTNGWINHCRRLDRHYEITLEAHEGSLILSQIALLLRRLDHSQLFDTL